MLYVFQVDQGKMFTLDMSLALETVEKFKRVVETVTKIPAEDQALLISGGQSLLAEHRVCNYVAGTDTNPIFVFNRNCQANPTIQASESHRRDLDDFVEKVKEAMKMQASYETICKRTALAEQFYMAGTEQKALFDRLVYEQHIQHQGWAAVVANLEDLCQNLENRLVGYEQIFHSYLSKLDQYRDLTMSFQDDLLILSRIPLLNCLKEQLVLERESMESIKNDMTLYDFLSLGSEGFAEGLYEMCVTSLQQFTKDSYYKYVAAAREILTMAASRNTREVSGLEQRLSGLDKLGRELKGCLDEQAQLMTTFQMNRNSTEAVSRAADKVAVSEQLSESHVHHLPVLEKNHRKILEITDRCVNAKNELISLLHKKVGKVMYVESRIAELDHELVLTVRKLLQLDDHFKALQQLHECPVLYLNAISEVVRRRVFSSAFLVWADYKSCRMLSIHNEELNKRREFQAQFDSHFLNSLFPGMEDVPPQFLTQTPSVFDSDLPKITEADVETLRRELPADLAVHLDVPDMTATTSFFQLTSDKDDIDKVMTNDENAAVEEKLMQVVQETGVASNFDQNLLKAIDSEGALATVHQLSHIKELDKGCESETDTEEFEKVGQSPFELHFDKTATAAISAATATTATTTTTSQRPVTQQDASTLTEDNLEFSRSAYDRLYSSYEQLRDMITQTVPALREDMAGARSDLTSSREDVELFLSQARDVWCSAMESFEKDNQERVQKLRVDHDMEVNDFRKMTMLKNEDLKALQNANASLNVEVLKAAKENAELGEKLKESNEKYSKELDEMKRQIEALAAEKERSIKEVTDRLKCEHRSELESIRARFKLMTMERSPSENSLEKIERGDCSSLTNTETILRQIKDNYESEREVAVSDAVMKESLKWQKKLAEEIDEIEAKHSLERHIVEKSGEEKERIIDELREEMKNLRLECCKYKTTIMQLTESEDDKSQSSEVVEKMEALTKERDELEAQLLKLRAENSEMLARSSAMMGASVSVFEGKMDAATSPIRVKRSTETSTAKSSGRLSIESCRVGDHVLVLWDEVHQNYRVLQDSHTSYFLHSDCMEALGLRIVDEQPNRVQCQGVVVDKEYCHARKSVNRFRVPKGSKFFRVRVKPLDEGVMEASRIEAAIQPVAQQQQPSTTPAAQPQMTQSQTPTSSVADFMTAEGTPAQSLPSSPARTLRTSWDSASAKSESLESNVIPEEKGDDDLSDEAVGHHHVVEKATELTENFSVQTTSIDR